MTQEIIAACNTSIVFGEKKILENITCSISAGEFVGIIGPNGAGKSTLLLALRGFVPLAAGEVLLAGRPITTLSDKELARQVAYMQQEVNVGFGFTALEVVLTGRYPYLKWWQHEQAEDKAIAHRYMEFTGVEALAEKPVHLMSGGEKQRVLLAKVLAQETPLIFLDEPTASLDLVYQEEIFRYCQLISQQGKTVLIVAHDLKLAAKFCSRLLLLAENTMIADGPPEKVITKENLQAAYGLHAAVFMNKVTGNLDIHTYAADDDNPNKDTKVHIICGGGSGEKIIRVLYERGYRLTLGVIQPGDADANAAEAFHLSCLLGQPFSSIDELAAEENRRKISAADWVVLSDLTYGEQNIDNLQAAFTAKNLIVIEDTPIEKRDFLEGKAIELYTKLVKMPQVAVMTFPQFITSLEKNMLPAVHR
ncbi:ABC transporter ATP-binding protein [Pelosinus propionicus]|uniref:Iron complex transport system ATP-binding protein n=1 Tax=Pelosinus propionicus DSM 13327 TaxID=1123291 RepID=A0A1I4N5Q4_9FIRM|nr:ABC transporter ATP-binding protein [Pelosinus propionicus]SFM10637.1 iron complex transport system ATP-binding protein [Pelosinus propionicus DSM 13327]